jgi:uncharacterized protein
MKLHLHTEANQYNITRHGQGYVEVAGQRILTPLIVSPTVLVQPWVLADPATITFEDFAQAMELKPALVVYGSGNAFRFPHPRVMAAFSSARIGFEVMDTAAACRTYNVLMSEGRNVVAALVV